MDSPNKVAPYDRCDYRCDSCIHFRKCRLFQQEAEQFTQDDEVDKIHNVLMSVKRSLVETLNSLQQSSTQLGLEFDILSRKSFNDILAPDTYPLYRLSYKFTQKVHKFLKKYWSKEPPKAEVKSLRTELDDLSWHHTLVSVKIARALTSQQDGDDYGFLDAKNSAEVAMTSLRICRFALGNIIERYGHYFDSVIDLLLLLNKLEGEIKKQFDRELSY